MTVSRPNLLVIYPDQMRYDAMGAAGNPVIRTPNIDALAREGVFLERAYTSFPLCCPFRASVMTGKYAHSNGMYANHYPIRLGQRWLADCLNDAGYWTGYVGKWHLNGGPKHAYVPPEYRCGFRRFIGFSRGHQYFGPIFYRDDDHTPRTSPKYEADMQTGHVLEIMEDAVARGRPFFAMVDYGIPHPPLLMPEQYGTLYDPDGVPVRGGTPETERDRAARFLARYYGMCTCVDDNVGRLLAWLAERGLEENTIVVFISDHGEMAGEFACWGKKTWHDGAMHVPLVVRWPAGLPGGVRPGHVVDAAVDLMPTVLDLCGVEVPTGVQGESLAPLLRHGTAPERDFVYYEILMERQGPEAFPLPERGIRTRDWLYVRRQDGPIALHDLTTDPLEQCNRVDDPACAAARAELDARLLGQMAETGDDWSIEAVFPPPDFMSHEEAPAYHRELLRRVVVEE
ncbi:MAG: sulfatase [Lentisphaeria bacterium]|nr:sulfatase [Lentisphaeria bacterium]